MGGGGGGLLAYTLSRFSFICFIEYIRRFGNFAMAVTDVHSVKSFGS